MSRWSKLKWNHSSYANILVYLLLFTLMIPNGTSLVNAMQEVVDPKQKAFDLLVQMTPEERIGQLMLISFDGRDITPTTPIYDLIVNHHIGGIVLRADNDNFIGPENTIPESYRLISGLQDIEFSATSNEEAKPDDQSTTTANYIPLFIGISQEGDSYPYDQVINGMTPLPNMMTIGATWNPEISKTVGSILGDELEAIGFNLLLGPSLDVLDIVGSENSEALGTRTFGGDPYWVGVMGKAYIEGIHSGSENRIAVIAKHFPGRGGSDRQPDEEVATVRKSLEQLKQIELAPFFAITGKAEYLKTMTDGLLISHTRYQGFQGNIRATTRPVSFDQSALDLLMSQPPLQSWYQETGVLVSDDLGSLAVRRFYDPTGMSFNGRQVARDAYLAGNDLLYLNDFVETGDPDAYTTILRTLEFFTQKYREDPIFSKKVDKSVERILTLKYTLYPEFDINKVIQDEESLTKIGQSGFDIQEVAQDAATLISPDQEELRTNIPVPPAIKDQIIFITDDLTARQCSQCNLQEILPVDGLEQAVFRLYGPTSGGQVVNYKLSSYSAKDLLAYLNSSSEMPSTIAADLSSPGWLVFGIRSITNDRPESQAFKRFLNERPDLLLNKQILAFAFNAPYFFDATDISKFTAYYCLYSQGGEFVDVAARLLFQEFAARGSLPVNVAGVGYDLITATSPDPDQVIPLSVELPWGGIVSEVGPLEIPTEEPLPMPTLSAGEMIQISTGIIYDHNNNPVPDGTVVRFLFSYLGEEGEDQSLDAITLNGAAKLSYEIRPHGLLEISAISDPALISELIQLNISSGEVVSLAELPPPPPMTVTPEPTLTVTVPVQITATEVPQTTQSSTASVGFWFFSNFLTWGAAGCIFVLARKKVSSRWGVRLGLLSALGGISAYLLLDILTPNQFDLIDNKGGGGNIIYIFLGVTLGFICGWLWYRWHYRRP